MLAGAPDYHGRVSEPTEPMSRRAARDAGNTRGTAAVDEATGTPVARTGIAALVAKHPAAWLAGALGTAFLLLAGGALAAGAAVGSSAQAPQESFAPEDTPVTEDGGRVVPTEQIDAQHLRSCSIASLASDDRIGKLHGYVVNADTGTVLYSASGTKAATPANLVQLVTASDAIAILGPDYRMTTKVYKGANDGEIVLVGGGDVTLSNTDPGEQSVYRDAPKLSDLADQVRGVLGETPVTSIVLDASYWDSKDSYNSTWSKSLLKKGTISHVTALQVDGDRSDPTKQASARSDDPIQRTGELFAERLGYPDAALTVGTVQEGAEEIARVQSQPVSSLINTMLLTADNTLAETLARVTSKEFGLDGAAASLTATATGALTELDVPADDLLIVDGSGTSTDNNIPPKFFTRLLTSIVDGGHNLNNVYNSLPVAGKTGTLEDRFTGDNEDARGNVIAATGSISGEKSIAGVAKAEDGTTLSFAFYAIGDEVGSSTAAALDTLTTGIFDCGDNLANG